MGNLNYNEETRKRIVKHIKKAGSFTKHDIQVEMSPRPNWKAIDSLMKVLLEEGKIEVVGSSKKVTIYRWKNAKS